MQNGQRINIYSIFRSINGEICRPGQGSWATFIRFSGCNLRCKWCDTVYAQEVDPSKALTIDFIMRIVEGLKCKNVTITGGEPLMQRNRLNELLQILLRNNYRVSVETNGSYPIIDNYIDVPISWVVDYKLPSSRENHHMHLVTPWSQLTKDNYIKFVIAGRADYDGALATVGRFWAEGIKAQMVFSPILDSLSVNELCDWMQENKLLSIPVSLQLHKLVKLREED